MLSTISLKAVPISIRNIINYAVESNHICDFNLIRDWTLGSSPSLQRGWSFPPLTKSSLFFNILHITTAQRYHRRNTLYWNPSNRGRLLLVWSPQTRLSKRTWKSACWWKASWWCQAMWKNHLLAFCCYKQPLPVVLLGPVKIQVICCITWVSQPFPGTLPNSTFEPGAS